MTTNDPGTFPEPIPEPGDGPGTDPLDPSDPEPDEQPADPFEPEAPAHIDPDAETAAHADDPDPEVPSA
jgi:hypothetical protein